ncbi:aspartate carbamoyltransferase catalytic subunit [Boudabousia marimammalium]|uniref:Aspartate carbamoyltransferase n=1 Tax=Boudabousia marimammalium TaxID=156892 RepID=A0A1Q5PSU1_9ACTO|nr:aspartate carbamoyltransferase catalytic subunit [Boudabousia marimammalium]OKL50522.1 aspartate carbamoyltransferase [Boudabousia marimammalium]
MTQPTSPAAHLLSIADLSIEDVLSLLDRAAEFKQGATPKIPSGLVAINMFFENSTRTMTSFQMAEHRLGMKVLDFNPDHSSLTKGESLYDSVRTVDAIGAHVAVIRHHQNAYYDELLETGHLRLSIVNGGDGSGQHPSQCLLDLLTIREEFGHFEGLKVAISGDIAHSRVARSNAEVLTRLGATVYFTGPHEWMDESITAWGTVARLDEILPQLDVCMMLRVQHERFDAGPDFKASDYLAAYGLTEERAARMPKHAIIMHPAPVNRGCELADALMEAPQSRIFPQMTNGVLVRMAMLERVLLNNSAAQQQKALAK